MKESILAKLEKLSDRYEELAALMSDPDVIGDQNLFREYSKEYAELEPVVKSFAAYNEAQADLEEAELMLMEDIRNVAIELADNRIYEKLDDARQTVLANMAFNLGMSRLGKFKKMWAALSRQDYQKAADEMMDSRWARQVGVRAKRLEAIMRTGEL